MEPTGLARFLFELASPQRLDILAAISERPLRHAQIARRLHMTDSETTRHLNRLASVSLVVKGPRGEYVPTNLTRLLFAGFPFFRILAANREFLLNHDVLVLPAEFVDRLGALSEGTFITGTYKVVDYQEHALTKVKRRIWVLTEHAFGQAISIMRTKASEGADVRVIRAQGEFEGPVPGMQRNYPVRLMERTRIFLAVLDETAGVCFPAADGKVDMSTMVLLQDSRGYRWAESLFLHYWALAAAPL